MKEPPEGEYITGEDAEPVYNKNNFLKPNALTKSKEVKKMEEETKTGEDAKKVNSAEEVQESEESQKVEVVDVDPTKLPEVETQYEDKIDYEKYRLKPNAIVSAEVVRLPSKYANAKDGKQHSLRITGTVVETVEVTDEKTKEVNTYEFRPSVLIGLVEDKEDGKLLGFPDAEESNWGKLKKTLDISKVEELVGKELPIRIIQKTPTSPKFLGYMIG